MKAPLLALFTIIFINLTAQNQSSILAKNNHYESSSIGVGIGLDYGGIGMNFTTYPIKNVGLFAGAGYNLADFAWNIGTKIRWVNNYQANYIVPSVSVMYGANAVIEIQDPRYGSSTYTSFNGVSLGGGIDICLLENKIIVSGALFHAFRDYDYLKETYQVTRGDFSEILFSLGLKYGIK